MFQKKMLATITQKICHLPNVFPWKWKETTTINDKLYTYNRRFFIILSPPPPVFAIYRNLNNQDQGIYHEVDLFTISTTTYTCTWIVQVVWEKYEKHEYVIMQFQYLNLLWTALNNLFWPNIRIYYR